MRNAISKLIPRQAIARVWIYRTAALAGLSLLGACAMQTPPDTQASPDKNEPVPITRARQSELTERQWVLARIAEGEEVVLAPEKPNITITFFPDGKVAGGAPVNRYFGKYQLDDAGRLQWPGPGFASTRMAGPPELMDQEQVYFQSLRKTSRILKTAKGIHLANDDGSLVLVFVLSGRD